MWGHIAPVESLSGIASEGGTGGDGAHRPTRTTDNPGCPALNGFGTRVLPARRPSPRIAWRWWSEGYGELSSPSGSEVLDFECEHVRMLNSEARALGVALVFARAGGGHAVRAREGKGQVNIQYTLHRNTIKFMKSDYY